MQFSFLRIFRISPWFIPTGAFFLLRICFKFAYVLSKPTSGTWYVLYLVAHACACWLLFGGRRCPCLFGLHCCGSHANPVLITPCLCRLNPCPLRFPPLPLASPLPPSSQNSSPPLPPPCLLSFTTLFSIFPCWYLQLLSICREYVTAIRIKAAVAETADVVSAPRRTGTQGGRYRLFFLRHKYDMSEPPGVQGN